MLIGGCHTIACSVACWWLIPFDTSWWYIKAAVGVIVVTVVPVAVEVVFVVVVEVVDDCDASSNDTESSAHPKKFFMVLRGLWVVIIPS